MQKRLSAAEMASLVNDHYGSMVAYARRRTGLSAEDIVQSAFLNLVRFNHEKGSPENPVFWLYQAIRNEAITQWRKESRLKDRERRNVDGDFHVTFVRAESGTKGELKSDGWTKNVEWENSKETGFDAEEVGRALGRLESDLREIVYLRIWGGLTFDEIAKMTGQSRSTVFRSYQEGLRRLKQDFDGGI